MRFVVLDAFESNRFAVFIEINFHLGKIEIERAVLETFSAQQRSELPSSVQSLAELAVRFRFQNRVSFFIGQSLRAANYGSGKAGIFCVAIFVKLNENRKRESIDAGI